jgi:DNA modification methylase
MSVYYSDEFVTLYHGDCLQVTEWLTADVLVTDPPYGIGWTRGVTKGAKGPRRDQANEGIANDKDTKARDLALVAWGTRPALVFGSLRADYPANWKRMLVFQKPLHSGLFGNRSPWRSDWEPIFVLGEWPDETRARSAVFKTSELAASGYNGYSTRAGHSHAKPIDVMTRLLETCPEGTVADPFAGSGSTLFAARNLGRKAIGVELEERYCEVIAKRLAQQAFDFGVIA